jgi:hypothetical protein
MHLLIFLRWINKHQDACVAGTTCTLCALRTLAREYWGAYGAISSTHAALTQIGLKANTYAAVGDAYNFYEWITSLWQMRDPLNIGVNDARCKWDNEYKAIFQLDVEERRVCSSCFAATASPQEYGIVCARYDMLRHQTLDDILED